MLVTSVVSRDQKLNVDHRYIGFMLILSVIIVNHGKKAFSWYIFVDFS